MKHKVTKYFWKTEDDHSQSVCEEYEDILRTVDNQIYCFLVWWEHTVKKMGIIFRDILVIFNVRDTTFLSVLLILTSKHVLDDWIEKVI